MGLVSLAGDIRSERVTLDKHKGSIGLAFHDVLSSYERNPCNRKTSHCCSGAVFDPRRDIITRKNSSKESSCTSLRHQEQKHEAVIEGSVLCTNVWKAEPLNLTQPNKSKPSRNLRRDKTELMASGRRSWIVGRRKLIIMGGIDN